MGQAMEATAAEFERNARRLDLDWVRIGAFGLLILYHVGMFYVPWDWHVKSPRPQEWLAPVMMLTHPWRLALLFLVSGAATRFMFDGMGGGRGAAKRLAGLRTWRLLPPIFLGMFVVVPPQSWLQVAEALHRAPEAYGSFWVKYATASGHWCGAKDCLVTPTWNHLWFVVYLFAYTLALCGLLACAPGVVRRVQTWGERALRGWGVMLWPAAALVAVRMTLAPRFPETHALVGDYALHAVSLLPFVFGVLFAKSETVWAEFVRRRWLAAGVALSAFLLLAGQEIVWPGDAVPPDAARRVMRAVYGIDQWATIVAVLGFARRHLATRDGPVRRYLTEAIFPFYIVHQTATVVAGHYLAPLNLPLPVEAVLLIGATAGTCLLTFEIVRRVDWLRPLFGLKPRAKSARRAPAVRQRIGLRALRKHAIVGADRVYGDVC